MATKKSYRQGPPAKSASHWTQSASAARWTLAFVVLITGVVRGAAAFGELWLDEVWSIRLAHLAATPAGVFTGIHIDNNHHLNTLYLQLLPETGASSIMYRLHVLGAGIASVVLAAAVGRRAGPGTAVSAAMLIGGSFLMTLYGSEARGYALAICFLFAAILTADRRGFLPRIGFGVLCALGVLSHITFLQAYGGLLIWTAIREKRGTSAVRWLRVMVAMHAIPIAATALLYWIDIAKIVEGGGQLTSPFRIAARAMSLATGGPETGSFTGLMALVGLGVALAGITVARRSGHDLWILFAVGGLAAPAVAIAMLDPKSSVIFERYFLVSIALLVLGAAWWIGRLIHRAPLMGVLVLAAYLAANGLHISRLIQYGRGHYVDAVAFIRDRSQGRRVTVGSDHDFRHGRMLEYYRPDTDDEFLYYPRDRWPLEGPEWLLTHNQETDFSPPATLTIRGADYTLRQFYRYGGLSGWNLALYQK